MSSSENKKMYGKKLCRFESSSPVHSTYHPVRILFPFFGYLVCTSLKWHNIVSVCIFIIIYKWGRRSRREGFSNLLHLPR
ncbi:MAG: hypothetical protein AAE985_00690, partial [Thermoplasmataceae archaeon]